MDENAFSGWLTRYGHAWESGDPLMAADLFTEDATYQETPFDEPMQGRQAIMDYWAEVPITQKEISFSFTPMAVAGDEGIANWRATYIRVSSGAAVTLDGIMLCIFAEDGCCRSFSEWWHRQEVGGPEEG